MRKLVGKIIAGIGGLLAAAFLLGRTALDVIGYSTSPEDAASIPIKVRPMIDWLANQPWAVAYGIPAALVLGAAWLIVRPTSALATTIDVSPTALRADWKIGDLFRHVRPDVLKEIDGRGVWLDVGTEIKQAFADAWLTVWGRPCPARGGLPPSSYQEMPTLRPIPADDWNYSEFTYEFFAAGSETNAHVTVHRPGQRASLFCDLQVNRAQAESIWAKPSLPSPLRDTKVIDGIFYIVSRKWETVDDVSGLIESIQTALGEFHQAALDGHIRVWGSLDREHQALGEIDKGFWATNSVRIEDLLDDKALHTRPVSSYTGGPYFYLQISSAEFERKWPTKPN